MSDDDDFKLPQLPSVHDELTDVAVMANDERLLSFVASWPRFPRNAKGSPDLHIVAEVLNVSTMEARELHRRALILGLVKIDGTIHQQARTFIARRLISSLRAPTRPPPREKPEADE